MTLYKLFADSPNLTGLNISIGEGSLNAANMMLDKTKIMYGTETNKNSFNKDSIEIIKDNVSTTLNSASGLTIEVDPSPFPNGGILTTQFWNGLRFTDSVLGDYSFNEEGLVQKLANSSSSLTDSSLYFNGKLGDVKQKSSIKTTGLTLYEDDNSILEVNKSSMNVSYDGKFTMKNVSGGIELNGTSISLESTGDLIVGESLTTAIGGGFSGLFIRVKIGNVSYKIPLHTNESPP